MLGKHGLALTFVLDAEEVDDIRIRDGLVDIVGPDNPFRRKDAAPECWGRRE
jgi:hypothetical protein